MVAFAGWEMPVQYDGADRRAPRRARDRRRLRRLAHGPDRDVRARRPRAARRCCRTNDVARVPIGGAQYSRALPRGRRRARRRLHLPPGGRALPDGHQRRQPRARPRLVRRPRRRMRRRGHRPRGRLRDDRRPGPARPRDRAGDRERAAARADDDRRAHARRRRGARRRHRLHRRGRRRAAARARPARSGVWNALLRRGAMPAGLAARDTLRTEVCYPLYGNELSTERGPIEAGLGWCCRSGRRLHRRRGGRARCARRARRSSSSRS